MERTTGSQVAREGAVNDRDGLFDRHRDEWQSAHNNTCALPAEEVARHAELGRIHLHDPQRGELMPQGVREGGRGEITCDSPADADGARVRLRIAGDGPGVPVNERARIFERFYRVPGTVQPGNGIGLSLVARIAESQGGAVEVAAGIEEHELAVILSFPKWLEPERWQR